MGEEIFTDDENYRLFVEKLLEAGLSKQQAASKTAKVVFAVCTDNPDLLKLLDLEQCINTAEEHLDIVEDNLKLYNRRLEDCKEEYEAVKNLIARYSDAVRADEIYEKDKEYIDSFNKSLAECETAEGRDAMSKAQVFANACDINTDANNTAFINGLACILSDGKCGSIFNGFNKKLEQIKPTEKEVKYY